jgi:hypothetical protein
MPGDRAIVVIAAPPEAELVAVDEQLDVRYQPDLLPPLRFPHPALLTQSAKEAR